MSGLASLSNIPGTDIERAQWAFAHMAHHRDINLAIYNLLKIVLPEFPLDPVDPDDTGTWEDQHQVAHDNFNAVLGIDGNDLTGIDWKDTNLLAGWVFLNQSEHYQASAILGIG